MNLAELQREAHAIAKDHGWWDEPRTFGDCIADVHEALSEARRAYREHGLEHGAAAVCDCFQSLGGHAADCPAYGYFDFATQKPEGVASELADVVIRVADMAEWYEWKLPQRQLLAFDPNESFGEHIVSAHEMLSDVRGSEPTDVLSDFVEYIRAMAARYGIDLDAAIRAKMEGRRCNGTDS